MTRNKPRLALALYARPKHPTTYHYALLLIPKPTPNSPFTPAATKYHVKNTLQVLPGDSSFSQPWRFERDELDDVSRDPRLLVCVVVAKVLKVGRLEEVVKGVSVDGDGGFSCRSWVRDVIGGLRRGEGVVRGLGEWEEVDGKAREYVERKKEEGRWDGGGKGEIGVPVLCLVSGEEVVR
ncbi:hypothetical protein BU24DRAFT_140365 [Aaosphaeria arxii CBS 175.79]|uniref:Uncharacterized protein n=1 Tax=Aaosphaeria arxii CBS 175.79 TaxID=1450172 RepID=A0A6A5XUA7_9PLEO|nr:uncharacterized protein BU24DRAFT_140365 [Aaosphaeria arxii CBS 175.79]KAF2016898.1 hypothetical protein BU24DRAFT_140365 [Aaosphaeria arxii CBS 175.79]